MCEQDGKLLGHIFFSPVTLEEDTADVRLIGLAPMAVTPNMQNKGIGSSLVEAGIEECRARKYDAIVVLGHHKFYPKFGFVPSVNYGIKSEYDVPDDTFMVLDLKPGILKAKHGTIRYHEAFGSV